MLNDRLEYYDPLYETITFEKGLPSDRIGFLNAEEPIDPRDIVQSGEFVRLAFLRQVGLAWLVFPSATHTRFAHSIGCWWLGRIAETLIKIKDDGWSPRSLQSWLTQMRLREEYYLSLLFHDIGHGPLSHVLESNDMFSNGLHAAGLKNVSHEHRGAYLLEGSGPLARSWEEYAPKRYGKAISTLDVTRRELAKCSDRVCMPAVCYLMTSDPTYLSRCTHSEHQSGLPLVKELVSGLLDLDRLDHYARDSYFSGVHQVSLNLRGFLNNLRFTPAASTRASGFILSLTNDGVSHAASLLFSKRQIVSTMFRNPRSIGLHAMANAALTAYLKDIGDETNLSAECLRIAMLEDDQFLEMISTSHHEGCRTMGQRMRAMQPYCFVGKWSKTEVTENFSQAKAKLEAYVNEKNKTGIPAILIHADEGFWDTGRAAIPKDWLDTSSLYMDENTNIPLIEHSDYKDDFLHLREANKIRNLWAFARNEISVDTIRRNIKGILLK